jgi:hypothetical protein
MQYLNEKPEPYLMVWVFLFVISNDSHEVETPYLNLLTKFKISRTTLRRVIDFGCKWTTSGQQVDSKWTDKLLIINFTTIDGGQQVDSKWTASGQKRGRKPSVKKISKENEIEFEEKEKSKSLYKSMIDLYDTFCKERTLMGAKINAHQGKAMKSIISYLTTQVKAKKQYTSEQDIDNDVLSAWSFILTKWSLLNDFYGSQVKLSQIDNNLPNILAQLRNNTKNKRDEKFANTQSEIAGTNFE